ncbi:hypothetical protein [uncultured Thiocystis sp.]|jgi:hypothetical protein|uniref:hypothetical protein n=1 Tax=uncultured Thiocystis sp. TaxID=1202134 RepID=UPI0025E8AD5C|nr:hypothetical protein [uncultured Thiocystis sp.]
MSDPRLPSARQTLIDTLPEETSLFGQPIEARFIHVPASHAKALHPDTQLVVGMRGAGKSFWWRALQDKRQRALVAERAPNTGLAKAAQVVAGFGETPNPDAYPGPDVLAQLVETGQDPRLVWRTVILHALTGGAVTQGDSWAQRVASVAQDPERMDRTLFEHDRQFDREDTYWIILFDALDRSASNWRTMNALIRGLLQAMLDLRPYRRLRAKSFLRTDQLDEREVGDFADASKVLAGRVDLDWPAYELYALLWQYLCNSVDGAFRLELETELRLTSQPFSDLWLPPVELRRSEAEQRRVFHAIAGPWMGRDHRRGYPYTWVPNHLADAGGRTSPRSFIVALRKAAAETADRYPTHTWPLHHESIKRGVQSASEVRVRELQEDYPWVNTLMVPLNGKVVPCAFAAIAKAWQETDTLHELERRVTERNERLPPAHLGQGADGVRQDLENLGIFLRLRDGRVNIPDVFRVGYGLGRRGGVRPVRPGDAG